MLAGALHYVFRLIYGIRRRVRAEQVEQDLRMRFYVLEFWYVFVCASLLRLFRNALYELLVLSHRKYGSRKTVASSCTLAFVSRHL